MSTNTKLPSRGLTSVMPFVAGGMLLFAGIFLFGGLAAYYLLEDGQWPEASAVAGVVQCETTHGSPLGPEVCFGQYQISGVRESTKSRFTKLESESIGDPAVVLVTADGERTIDVPKHHHNRWTGCRAEYRKVGSLESIGLAWKPAWKREFRTYSVTAWGLKPGDSVTVEADSQGQIRQIWCGTPESIAELENDQRMMGFQLFGGAGLLMSMFGLFILGFAF